MRSTKVGAAASMIRAAELRILGSLDLPHVVLVEYKATHIFLELLDLTDHASKLVFITYFGWPTSMAETSASDHCRAQSQHVTTAPGILEPSCTARLQL